MIANDESEKFFCNENQSFEKNGLENLNLWFWFIEWIYAWIGWLNHMIDCDEVKV